LGAIMLSVAAAPQQLHRRQRQKAGKG